VKTRGLLAALAVIALLAGCASFVDQFGERARDDRAASSSSSTSSTSRSTSTSATTSSEATTSSSASSTSAGPTTQSSAPTSGGATTAAGTTSPPAPPPAPPANKPQEVGAAYGQEPWAVYLVAAQDYSAAERSRMEAAHRDLQAFGYRGFLGTLCDEGAESAGVDPYGDAVVIYFRTQAEAQQFISLWNRPVAGSARVLIVCGD
jgi:cell division septation protein DedD